MRAPLSWIREFTPVEASTDELVAALNQVGLEVEGVDEPGRDVRGVIAARVLDVVKHPKADKLTLVDVDFGSDATRVVCGAQNVAAGDVVPYAPAGAHLPEPFGILERRTIRGVTSDGMLLAPDELGLGDDHEGIVHLDGSTKPGTDVRELLGLDDVIFDLSITPNRPDAMCIVGVARELAAHFGLPLQVLGARAPIDSEVRSDITVRVDAPDRCPRYLARVAQVTTGPSPSWMAQRLVKAGMRPISNVVDVTNYVLLERNQPLHAFDLGRLGGRGILVRLADRGEHITTLDGVDRALTEEDLLICDAAGAPQAIAGVMGGGTSEVSDDTSEILLEAAYFERMGIARTSKRLKLRSESSARFERGIDPNRVAEHAERAMELFAEVAGAMVASDAVDEYPHPVERVRIHVRTSKVNGVLGTELRDTEILDALRPLGIEVDGGGDDITAVAPTFRPDLEREIDIVEEVARRVGFASIGRTVARPREQVGGLTHRQRERRVIADALVGAGLSEAVTIPLVAPTDLERAGAPLERLVEAANPLRAEESVLRTRILPGLLRAVANNHAHGLTDVGLFEVGRVFLAPSGKRALLPEEPTHVAVALSGTVRRRPVEADRPIDLFDAVDVLHEVFDAVEIADGKTEAAARPGFDPARAAAVLVDGHEIGVVGELDPALVVTLELTPPVVGFELDLDPLLDGRRRDRAFRPPSPYPPSSIDLAFVVDEDVAAGDVAETLRRAAGDVLEEVRLFDVFRSDALAEGRKSLAFSLRFRAPNRTLTDDEVGEIRRRCVEAAAREHHGELRG
ncbi:MAG TPA: phenylalanine--tRNA ligase subunit beta [Acidimicrobiia bacterium]|nr:phenylalanine--tRNA ligase subunit beta [Acidimicrobiia bacterium]